MMRSVAAGAVWLALAGSLLAAPAMARGQAPAVATSPARIGGALFRAVEFDLTATNGKAYRIRVSIPQSPPPKDGFPILYVLDGDAYFGSFADAVALRGTLGREIAPAIVVGVGRPPSDDLASLFADRMEDFTPTRATAPGAPRSGGADRFLAVIRDEIEPRIAALAGIDRNRRALFGHSLGGLFVLHALFADPGAFRTYLALSPSIWWDGRALLKDEAGFAARLSASAAAPRIFVGVGGLEQSITDPAHSQALKDEIAANRMIDNARELSVRLEAMKAAPGYAVRFRAYDGRTHLGVPWAALDDLIAFALPPDQERDRP